MRDSLGIHGGGPVVTIGLDACDPATVLRLAAEGELPVLARLLETSARATIRNPPGLFVSGLWPGFATAAGTDRHGFHCWDAVDPESYRRELITPDIALPYFWDRIGASGRRIAIVDVPHTRFTRPVNGVAVAEWGCHDRHFGFHSQPPEAAREIEATEGLHPVLGIEPRAARDFAPDDFVHRAGLHRTPAENRALLDGLLEGVERKRRLLSRLLARERWDLFVGVFGEAHAAGHQFWHLGDPAHPRHDPQAAAALGGDPIRAVYRALDAALGALAAQIGPGATLLVSLSHGMAAHHDGTHLLEEALRRLDGVYRGLPAGPVELARRALQRAAAPIGRAKLPQQAREIAVRALRAPEYASAWRRSRQLFYLAPNNTVFGGIRFNLAGREPCGRVDPGGLDALAARLEADLPALVACDTGRPVIRAVERNRLAQRRAARDSLPDLFLDWERSAPIERVRSPATGILASPYLGWRTGDHRPDGLLIAHGPGMAAGAEMAPIRVEDIPVSIAAKLGVGLPGADGAAALWLAGKAAGAGALA